MRKKDVLIAENTNQGWTAPKRIKSVPDNTWSPCLSPDADSIFYTVTESDPRIKHYDLYRCDRTGQGWSKPRRLGPPLSSSDKEVTCSIAANNSLYLDSERKGTDGRSTIWIAPYVDNAWAQAEQLCLDFPQAHDAGIAPDESFMVFTAKNVWGGYGHRDLYVTVRLPDGDWSTPRNLGPKINSNYNEYGPRISPDKKYLFFSRCNGWDPRKNDSDIYWVELREHLPDPNDPKVNQTNFGFGLVDSSAGPFAKGPYLGQTPPGSTPQVFAPGLICDTRPHQGEGHVSFSADGNTLCFGRFGYVFITENTNQGWTTPERVTSIPFMVWSPCLSPDANSIYFTYSYDTSKRYSLHRCVRTSQGWSLPQKLGPPFIVSGVFGGFSVAGNHSIYFTSDADHGGRVPNSRLQWSFQFAPLVGNTWPRGIKIPLEQGNLHCCHPGIAPDESFMVFYSIRPGAQRGTETDLYLSLRRPDGTWTKPRNMGPKINSRYYEIGARISPDKKYMFFIRSNGWWGNSNTDTSDIYWVALKDYLPESYR
jgi:Tol biopolymer transport system component